MKINNTEIEGADALIAGSAFLIFITLFALAYMIPSIYPGGGIYIAEKIYNEYPASDVLPNHTLPNDHMFILTGDFQEISRYINTTGYGCDGQASLLVASYIEPGTFTFKNLDVRALLRCT